MFAKHRLRSIVFLAAALHVFTYAAAEPITDDEMHQGLRAIYQRDADVFASGPTGLFRAELKDKKWVRLETPASMPPHGEFGKVPKDSEHVLYRVAKWNMYPPAHDRDGYVYGLYDSTDNGRTWKLLSQNDDYGPSLLLPNGSLFVITNPHMSQGHGGVHISKDMGQTWRNITGNAFGEMYALFPDPANASLVCIGTNSMRGYILQAKDENFEWKPIRGAYIPEGLWTQDQVFFNRDYSSSTVLYSFTATLDRYFKYKFNGSSRLHGLEIIPKADKFVFERSQRVIVPVEVVFLTSMSNSKKVQDRISKREGVPAVDLSEVVIVDSTVQAACWSFKVEHAKAYTTATDNLATEPYVGDSDLKRIAVTHENPYHRTLDLSSMYRFTEPGEYRVKIKYQSPHGAMRERGDWKGVFDSDVFTVVIK